jgi:hypothetical protein
MNAAAARELTTAYKLRGLARKLAPTAAVGKALQAAGAVAAADYLTLVRGLAGGVLRSVQGTFGKRVKALAVELGITTLSIPTVIQNGGRTREINVAAYAPANAVRLFTAVWDAHYAK